MQVCTQIHPKERAKQPEPTEYDWSGLMPL